MKLFVCLEGELAGVLDFSDSKTEFQYSESWLAAAGAYPLSYSLPLRPDAFAGEALVNFLWGLLPDNARTLDAWARRFGVSLRNPAGLLAHIGEDCAGAVQLVSEERLEAVLGPETQAVQVQWLSEAEVEDRIQRLARDGAEGRVTVEEGQFSLGGAQSKTAWHFDARRNRWGIPRGRTPTTHILKPLTLEFEGFAENEHFCLGLARRMGIPAAHTEWRRMGGVPTLIAERYDRIQLDGRWRRIHQEDCCQAVGVHPGSKYESEGGPGFVRLMRLLDSSDDPQADQEGLMRTAAFSYLLAATDMHAKNYSLLYSRGAARPAMRLAPLYDIASIWPYEQKILPRRMKLAMRVGRHYRLADIVPRHFEELARDCRFSPERMLGLLRKMAERLPDEASSLLKEIRTAGMARPVLSRLVDGIARQCGQYLQAELAGRP